MTQKKLTPQTAKIRTMQPILQRRSKLFINIFSLYLRMCIFCCTFAAKLAS